MSISTLPGNLSQASSDKPQPYIKTNQADFVSESTAFKQKRVFVRRFNVQDHTYGVWREGETMTYVCPEDTTNGHCIGQKVKVSMAMDIKFEDPQLYFACRSELLHLSNEKIKFKELYQITVDGRAVWVPAKSFHINHRKAYIVEVLAGDYRGRIFQNVLLSQPLIPGNVQLLLYHGSGTVDINALRVLESQNDLGWKLAMIGL